MADAALRGTKWTVLMTNALCIQAQTYSYGLVHYFHSFLPFSYTMDDTLGLLRELSYPDCSCKKSLITT
ncbi:hypothetical protein J5N97_026696 [Dioscorea zingiberensis]|uniref:Uncharacterized protein n=1 Tax=Dioscorea zingiberensis TaxID=325984 RepID=A0A9D5C3E2_9LILI|nr:hypothetical protein J5N97_026696 [Dioscorea zingiberensis]